VDLVRERGDKAIHPLREPRLHTDQATDADPTSPNFPWPPGAGRNAQGVHGPIWDCMGFDGSQWVLCGRLWTKRRALRRAVAKKGWRAARLALLGRLAGQPNASASRDAVLCLRSPRVRNGRRLRRGDLPYAPGGRDAARMGWWARSRSPGAGPGQGVRRQARLAM